MPLPEVQAKAVRDWLKNPAFDTFVSWLANKAAAYAAESGNLMMRGTAPDKIEAERKADEGRKYAEAWEIMLQFADRNFTPELTQLTPRPVTTKQEN